MFSKKNCNRVLKPKQFRVLKRFVVFVCVKCDLAEKAYLNITLNRGNVCVFWCLHLWCKVFLFKLFYAEALARSYEQGVHIKRIRRGSMIVLRIDFQSIFSLNSCLCSSLKTWKMLFSIKSEPACYCRNKLISYHFQIFHLLKTYNRTEMLYWSRSAPYMFQL